MGSKTIKDVLKKHADNLMNIPGVVGTAEGIHDNRICIKVFVAKITPDVLMKIPESIEGFEVKVEESGVFRAFPK